MERYVKYFLHGHGSCSLEEEHYWPSLLTAANNIETLRSELAVLPGCPDDFYLLLRLPNSTSWLHEQAQKVLSGLPIAEMYVRVVPGMRLPALAEQDVDVHGHLVL